MKNQKILERLDAASVSIVYLEAELRAIKQKDEEIDRGILYHNRAGYCPFCQGGTYWDRAIVLEGRTTEPYHSCRVCLSIIEIKGDSDGRFPRPA